jgi:hypothetical protein
MIDLKGGKLSDAGAAEHVQHQAEADTGGATLMLVQEVGCSLRKKRIRYAASATTFRLAPSSREQSLMFGCKDGRSALNGR